MTRAERDTLVRRHLGFVWSRVARRAGPRVARHVREELFQAGCLGLLHALERYDAARGALTTWAAPWVDAAVAEAWREGLSVLPGYRGTVTHNGRAVQVWRPGPTVVDEGEVPEGWAAAAPEGVDVERVRAAVVAHAGGGAAVARRVDLFLRHLLEGATHAQLAEAEGVNRARAGQLVGWGRQDFEAWAAQARAELEAA